MSGKVIVIGGYGPGIGQAVAEKFGGLGYKLALLSRTQSKLDEAAKAFTAKGIPAKGFSVDLGNPAAVRDTIKAVRSFGQIGIIVWNPYGPHGGVLDASIDIIVSNFNTTTTSLLVAVQEAIEDLRATKGAILVTGGGFSLENPMVVKLAVEWNVSAIAIAKAAQRKAVFLLHETLFAKDGIYAGEVTILGGVKGTNFDDGTATVEPRSVANAFEALNNTRDKIFLPLKE
ncbi:hypothetical protein HDU97_005001 [Phlyctochytrium planicorne]|nr:hypothetical protein HDU97_005001 [Phlyctochytrium planicorne]